MFRKVVNGQREVERLADKATKKAQKAQDKGKRNAQQLVIRAETLQAEAGGWEDE